jgi:hypothetical protein
MKFLNNISDNKMPKIYERDADYYASSAAAYQHGGRLIKFERLLSLLEDRQFVNMIEATVSYRNDGFVRLWTGTVGTERSGFYAVVPGMRRSDERLSFTSSSMDDKVLAVPFSKRAYFIKGKAPLAVDISGESIENKRLMVYGNMDVHMPGYAIVVEPIVPLEKVGNVIFAESLFRRK